MLCFMRMFWWKSRSFYFPEKIFVYIYKHPGKFVHSKNLSLGHTQKYGHAKSKQKSPAKIISLR